MARPSNATSLSKAKKKSKLATSINDLENKLKVAISQNVSLNPLVELLDPARNAQDPRDTNKAVQALHRIFAVIVASGKVSNAATEESKIVRTWIWERLNSFVDFLTSLLADEEKILKMRGIFETLPTDILFGLLLCPRSKRPSSRQTTGMDDYGKIDPDVKDLFVENWLSPYDDIRWFFLRESDRLLSAYTEKSGNHLAANLLSILERLKKFPTKASEIRAWWVEGFGRPPPHPRKGTSAADPLDTDDREQNDQEGEDDWRKFFDEDDLTARASQERKSPAVRIHIRILGSRCKILQAA